MRAYMILVIENIIYEKSIIRTNGPLVTHLYETRGRQVLVKFTCPVSGTEVQSSAHVRKEQSMSNTIANNAQDLYYLMVYKMPYLKWFEMYLVITCLGESLAILHVKLFVK